MEPGWAEARCAPSQKEGERGDMRSEEGMKTYIFDKSEAELVIFSMMCELNKGELEIVEDSILYSGDSDGFNS